MDVRDETIYKDDAIQAVHRAFWERSDKGGEASYIADMVTSKAVSYINELTPIPPQTNMTVDLLRKEAKALGYNIIKINPKEKLLCCVCGRNRRGHWTTYVKGVAYITLRCECGREALGRTDREVRHNWNEMVRREKYGSD